MSTIDDRRLSRRGLLGAGLTAAGALALGRGTLSAAPAAPAQGTADQPGPYGPFKMGLQSYSLRGFTKGGKPDLDKALQVTRDLGLRYWEAYPAHVPTTTDPAQAAEAKKRLDDAGVSLLGYGVNHFGKDHDANRKLFEFAKLMGLGYLSADPDPASFDSLDKLTEEYGVAIGIHNHGPGHRYAKIDTIADAIKDHSPKIGCCVDTGHFLRSREDPVRAVEVFGKRVYGVHLKDVKDARTFTVLGQGDLRTIDLLKALAKLEYGYCLALEYEEHPEDPTDEIRQCLAVTRQAVARSKGG
jgi:sugar phosphate isomerase/epimerase